MLRLRLQLPARGSIRFGGAALLPSPTDSTAGSRPVIALPSDPTQQRAAVENAATGPQAPVSPIVQLPAHISAGVMLEIRDRIRQRWPAALIVPAGATASGQSPAARPAYLDWSVCAFYLAALLALALRRVHQYARPLLEIAVCLIGPFWLIAGLNWGLRPTAIGLVAFTGGIVYAAIIEWRTRPRPWRWLGDRHTWLQPLLLVPMTLLLLACFSHGMQPVKPLHAVTYLLWASLQQWLMLGVVMTRLEQSVRNPVWVIAITASLFALLHIPNGLLMQICLLAEIWWAWSFMRSRSLLPIALAHATCALLVESGLGGGLLRSLEVSARFFA
jgi:succinate dehydrogenase hydrophobic anchor subunit